MATVKTLDRRAASFRRQLDDPTRAVSAARAYFDTLDLPAADTYDPTIQDSDGLVSYVVATSNPPPDSVKELYDEVAPVMEGLTNVVTSAVLKLAGTDEVKKHDPKTWQAPMQAMTKAFCGGFSMGSKHYDQTVQGVQIATKFLNILMEAVVNEGAALADFVSFLGSQGEAIRLETSKATQSYLYASVSIVHELFEAQDGRWIYVPKFKSYFTKFDQETLKVSTICGSYDKFRFNFDLQVMTGAFMVESWKTSQDFRESVRTFIQDYQKVNIEDSANYFDGIFNSSFDPGPE